MTSSLMDLLPLRLSPLPNHHTSWALAREPLRGRGTTPQTTKGSRTWSPMQRHPALTRAYRARCSPSQGTPTGADQVLPSPWPVTPVTVLPCPIKARRWQRPRPGEGQNSWRSNHSPSCPFVPAPGGWMLASSIQEKNWKRRKKLLKAKKKKSRFYWGLFNKKQKNEQK